jgi:hypothetical protein
MSTAPGATSPLGLLLQSDATNRQLVRGWVDGVDTDGTVRVLAQDGVMVVRCDRLVVAEGAELRLARGDVVVYWEPEAKHDRGVVLGRIGASHVSLPASVADVPLAIPTAGPAAAEPDVTTVPDEIVLEARQQLTLRVGDGSITLRADGKIQIKGKDLVSHAQRLNRIKGGAVSIN